MRKAPPLIHALILSVLAAIPISAQNPAPGPDVLVLTSGERLTGRLQDAVAGKVDFTSDALGAISVDWSKVQELHATEPFAVIEKNVKLSKNVNVSGIPQGVLSATGQTITVMPPGGAPAQTVPVAAVVDVIQQQAFLNAVQRNPNFLRGWTGSASFGAALVEATQSSTTITSSVSLVRAIPSESWLEPRNRTVADFSSAYGQLSQPATPTVKTSIFHADAERDEYFRDDIFAAVTTAFDHNFSQGLDLQQIYGLGLGWTILKKTNQTLDVQGSITYERQSFFIASLDRNLVGSIFSQTYNRKFLGGVTLGEKISANPAWNVTGAYSANASVALGFPLYKNFSLTTAAADAFLNDPPPGFKKNSFQFTTAVTYNFK